MFPRKIQSKIKGKNKPKTDDQHSLTVTYSNSAKRIFNAETEESFYIYPKKPDLKKVFDIAPVSVAPKKPKAKTALNEDLFYRETYRIDMIQDGGYWHGWSDGESSSEGSHLVSHLSGSAMAFFHGVDTTVRAPSVSSEESKFVDGIKRRTLSK